MKTAARPTKLWKAATNWGRSSTKHELLVLDGEWKMRNKVRTGGEYEE